jgi:hypothetical protein
VQAFYKWKIGIRGGRMSKDMEWMLAIFAFCVCSIVMAAFKPKRIYPPDSITIDPKQEMRKVGR